MKMRDLISENNKADLAWSAFKRFFEEGFDDEVKAFINKKLFRPGSCEDVSFCLAQLLDANGYRDRTKVAFGSYEGQPRPGYEGGKGTHIWVEVDGKIADLTAGQFEDYPNMDPSKYKVRRRV